MTSPARVSAPRAISVLFVDDDADTRVAYRLLAKQEGMDVEVTHDGHEAIILANTLLPDVIVLDVGLRSRDGLDGYEVARRLRASPSTGKIPIVIVSGHDSARDRAAAAAVGCEGRLVKPCSADALFDLVKDLGTRRDDETLASMARASNE